MLSLQIQPTTTNRPRRARSGGANARRKAAVANEAHSYHPSLVNRIVAISSIDGTVNYTYGIGGNSAPELLRTADYSNAAIPDEVYNHDQNYNRILDSEHGAGFVYGPGNRLVSDGIYNYQYDHEGNMTRRTEIATGDYRVFNYDERNRLVALADYDFAGATLMTEQMSYDAFDRRISLQVDTAPGDGVEAAVTHFGYDGEDVIVDAVDPDGASGPAAAAVETTYLHGAGIDEVLAQEKAGMGTQWLLTDHLGSTRDIVDNSGSVLNHIIFSSFGGIVSQSNAAFSSRYLYTQREFDAASGLNYYRARYYDSGVGRFLSEDPIRSSNLYAYADNAPTIYADPFGRDVIVLNRPVFRAGPLRIGGPLGGHNAQIIGPVKGSLGDDLYFYVSFRSKHGLPIDQGDADIEIFPSKSAALNYARNQGYTGQRTYPSTPEDTQKALSDLSRYVQGPYFLVGRSCGDAVDATLGKTGINFPGYKPGVVPNLQFRKNLNVPGTK